MPKLTFLPMNKTVDAEAGESVMEAAHHNGVELEGACEGSLACSTCHVIVAPEWFDKLPEAEDEEEDMLDRAFGLTSTSRLGCQVIMTEELDGLVVTIPEYNRNMRVDQK
ncbi:ferredoxin family 2Fe-2S iron-sulfur cluster binding protein [Magnetofaba australis]|uniref:Putative ferredoxin n=1 Tax=Magnetofaba australis IT-1 TaxID=1434232 RepID=A0A1Y2K376_9PROT|nr:ferredoxin family 2Fe-2S iron-sulfur cluster binding protein [Magnetofaba australis]OSM02409.1 putative ferredoxin [Magnetofaba australis IT-1]